MNTKISTTARNKNDFHADDVEGEDYVVYLGDNVPIVIKPTEKKAKPKSMVNNEKSKGKNLIFSNMIVDSSCNCLLFSVFISIRKSRNQCSLRK